MPPQAHVLERPTDAHGGDLIRAKSYDILPVKDYLALGRLVNACDQVEDRGFAGAIGAYQASDLTLFDREPKVVNGSQTAKKDREILNL
ncbi:MAG: hypothetical protein P8Y03_07700 [Anaerolineales bacterium]